MHRGTCFPAPVSEKKVLNESSSTPLSASGGICPLRIDITQMGFVSSRVQSNRNHSRRISLARAFTPLPPETNDRDRARASNHTHKKTRTPVESRVRDNTVPNTSSPFGSQPARCARRSLPACRSFSLFVRVFVSRERRSDDRAFGWSDIGERVDVAAANLDARARVTHGARRPFASIRCDSNPSPCLIVHL